MVATLFLEGVEIIPYFFAFLFSQTLATYTLEVGCHPLRHNGYIWITSHCIFPQLLGKDVGMWSGIDDPIPND